MRIGINMLGAVSQDTGGRNYIVNITKAFQELDTGHTYVLFMSEGEQHILETDASCFEIVELPHTKGNAIYKVIGEQIFLPFQIDRQKIDVMYFPGNFASYFCRPPYVLAIRSMLYYHYPYAVNRTRRYYRKAMTPLSVQKAFRVITPSYDIKEDVKRFIKVRDYKISVIHHGVDVDLFGTAGDPSERRKVMEQLGIRTPFLLYVSALWAYKNQDKLIQAFKLLIDRYHIPHVLILVGRGINSFGKYECSLRRMVQKMRLQERVLFTGFVEHKYLRYLYQAADIFVFPSSYESFGNPLFEAMAAGTPVVASNKHSFPEMAGDAAVLVNPLEIEEMACAIHKVLTDTDLRKRLVVKGYRRVQDFSWSQCARETLSTIESAYQRR